MSKSISDIIERTLVPHLAFENAQLRLDQCFRNAERGLSEPVCLAILGESRTGKSRALEEFQRKHPTVRTNDGLIIPILKIKVPSKPTVKSLAELMLRSLGDELAEKGTENSKTFRLRKLLRECQVRVMVIDEFQHFYDRGSHKVMHHVADWLKVLVDDSQVALVVGGLPSCQAVLDQNEQLRGRFLAPVTMRRFDWLNEADRGEFIDILGAFQDVLDPHFDMPALDDPLLAFRCYLATGGLIGYLSKLLRQLMWNAADAGAQVITLEDLMKAHHEAVFREEAIFGAGPFSRDFEMALGEGELVANAQQIGTRAEPPIESHRRNRPRRIDAPSLGDILRT